MEYPQEKKEDEEDGGGLVELPQPHEPVKGEIKRLSILSSLFDKGNKVSKIQEVDFLIL